MYRQILVPTIVNFLDAEVAHLRQLAANFCDEDIDEHNDRDTHPAETESNHVRFRQFPEFPVGAWEHFIALDEHGVVDALLDFDRVQRSVGNGGRVDTRVEFTEHPFAIRLCEQTDRE